MSILHPAVDVGSPPRDFIPRQDWEVTPVQFHGFEDLDASRGSSVESPEFVRFGHRWCLGIFPGGNGGPFSRDGMVSVYLEHKSVEDSIEVKYSFAVKSSDGKDVEHCDRDVFENTFAHGPENLFSYGCTNFVLRSDIMNDLVHGTLLIDVRMRRSDPSPPSAPVPFVAENPCGKMILEMFMDEESSDVVLEVKDGDDQVRNTRKRTSTSLVQFHAHRVILKKCAPVLAELCGSPGSTSVPIADVRSEIFRHMLYYVYGGKVAEEDMKLHYKEIIEAANKYGVVNLKLEAEASYVMSTTISIDNVMEHLLYADAMNCALLKEAVMDFIVENRAEVLEKVSLNDAPGGVLADLLAASIRRDSGGADDHELNAMRISDLRKKLHEKGLNIDGSRETLIATLKKNA
ncbi:hypothetical protein ACHAXR_009848 [Thalassiosira sp. AJA248-18]